MIPYQRPLPGYRELVDVAAMLGLKGSQRIVFEEVQRLLEMEEKVSVMKVSFLTNYHYVTVWRALCELREIGLLNVEQPKRGTSAEYSIAIEV
jgi:hypothetical protein